MRFGTIAAKSLFLMGGWGLEGLAEGKVSERSN